ncbi:MAG: solute-binding protein [Blautia sp.]|nr:solute-binding protein [Blautia sp.]
MGKKRYIVQRAGLAFAGFAFHIALYVCVAVLIFWLGKQAYQFGYEVFDQKAVSPGAGQEITIIIPQGTSDYQIGKILEENGLISDARVFFVQELLSNYYGNLNSGVFTLSTAYTPSRIMSVLAGEEEETEGAGS